MLTELRLTQLSADVFHIATRKWVQPDTLSTEQLIQDAAKHTFHLKIKIADIIREALKQAEAPDDE